MGWADLGRCHTNTKQQTISNTKNSHFFFNYAVFCDCRWQIAGNRNVFENMMDKLLVTEMCLENMMDKLLVTEKGFENMKCVFENIMDQFTGSRNMFANSYKTCNKVVLLSLTRAGYLIYILS